MTYEWDPSPPTVKQRAVAGLLVALILLTSANLYFEWRYFAGHDKEAEVLAVVAALIAFGFWMPTVRRI